MPRESATHTFLVALTLCVVCSVLVSAAAVGLRPAQDRNRELEIQRNIVQAAGLSESAEPSDSQIRELFTQVEKRLIDLETGAYISPEQAESAGIDPNEYDQREAASNPDRSIPIPPELDYAGIGRREKYSYVYLVKNSDGSLDQIVLPVYGQGLWSTLYGFLALDANMRTIRGLTFYEHGETPGLGGEIDNPAWKDQWKGKQAFNEDYDVQIRVIKGAVDPQDELAMYKIDGLSGATITSNAVTNLLRYWLGDHGFGPYLANLRAERE